MANVNSKTLQGFGHEWEHFDQDSLSEKELLNQFTSYFKNFPFRLTEKSFDMDVGYSSGKWAKP